MTFFGLKTYREASNDGSGARPHVWSVVNPENPEELDVSPDVENCPEELLHPGLCAVGALVHTAAVLLHTEQHQAVLPGSEMASTVVVIPLNRPKV